MAAHCISCNIDTNELIFIQDGVPAHLAKMTRDTIRGLFPRGFISREEKTIWPARSPDLNVLDFFCGALLRRLCTLEAIKQ